MKYECNWCNHTRPCVVEYSGSNECKPDRCMISPEQAGAFELVEDHECEWERSEILDIELKAAQKNEEAPETIDNSKSEQCCDNPNICFYGLNETKCYNCGEIFSK